MRSLLPLLLLAAACDPGFADPSREFAEPFDRSQQHPEEIKKPDPIGVWDSPLVDDPTVPKHAACVTCHGPNPKTPASKTPGGKAPAPKPPPGPVPVGEVFHTTVELNHGTLTCNQCHDLDRTVLHLADGTTMDFSETLQLCAQCHGPQFKDYQHGAHGGVNGYWDTTQGPRVRNHCVDCHSPHSPRFEQVMPVFPPRDRYYGGH